jgi:K+-transporting ATPase ATPase A chain
MLLTYVVLRLQHLLPLNPQGFAAVPDRQAFETAASFTTNTNWQSYSGESTMSYLSQMTQLAFHNFMSAAVGVAVAVAFARGIVRRSAGRLGNFWADLVRGTLYLFLPLSALLALLFVQQGRDPELRALRDGHHGCGLGQGDLFAKPLEPAAASALLAQSAQADHRTA